MIRAARIEELEDLVALGEAIGGLTVARARELFGEAVAAGECLVHCAERGGLDGFVLMQPRSFFGRDFVKLLGVAPDRRREGVATALLDAVLARATTPAVFISTNESNGAMRSLLDRHGWTVSGTLSGLDEGDPEIVYWRSSPAPH